MAARSSKRREAAQLRECPLQGEGVACLELAALEWAALPGAPWRKRGPMLWLLHDRSPGLAAPRGPSRENSVEGRRNVPPSTRPDSSRRPSDVPGKVAVAVKQLSREEWETKMKGIVEEFLNNRDVKEMMECIKELDAQSNKNLITECSINHVLEKSDSARKAVGNMLAELIKHELLPLDLHLKGVAAVLEFAEDLAIDIPNVWNYLGQLIAPMFTVASIPLSKLEPVCTPLLDIGKSATLAAEILKEASHNSNSSDVGKRWSDSGLTWSTFLPSGEGLDEFIKSNKLEYTLGDTSATSSSSPVSQDLFSTIGPLLQSSDTKSNDQIFDKINASIPEALREEQSFIKSLTTCVAKSCIENGKFVEGIFKNRSAVLTKYLDNRVEREESALIALEELMDELEHPAGLLSDFCYAFSDDDLVSDESFFSWEKNSKSGIAVKSVSNFFKWLREDNDNTQ
ncbi:EIF4G3 [Bugula neritina]|uniref:EIF4G3 n=1 Tax=Bugula neritina TaxID=10212 RepID=A0A7J7JPH3_BUGNE|nr:EIF4G3 [Bugula neritina]